MISRNCRGRKARAMTVAPMNAKAMLPVIVVAAAVVSAQTIPCTVQSVNRYADRDAKLTVRCDTNGDPIIPKGTTFTLQRPRGEGSGDAGTLASKPLFN